MACWREVRLEKRWDLSEPSPVVFYARVDKVVISALRTLGSSGLSVLSCWMSWGSASAAL